MLGREVLRGGLRGRRLGMSGDGRGGATETEWPDRLFEKVIV